MQHAPVDSFVYEHEARTRKLTASYPKFNVGDDVPAYLQPYKEH